METFAASLSTDRLAVLVGIPATVDDVAEEDADTTKDDDAPDDEDDEEVLEEELPALSACTS